MAIQGLRNTTSFDTPGGRRPQNFREAILMLYPNGGGIEKAPLTALTAVMRSEATDDPVFHWFTKQLQDRRLKLAVDLAGSDVAGAVVNVNVDPSYNGAFSVKEGDLLMVEQTNEIMYVNTTPAASGVVQVIRGFDLANGAALTAVDHDGNGINPFLVVVGSAFEEGSAAPDPISFDPVEVFNQTQIFRGTYGLTNTAAATRTRLGNEEAENKREALENFGIDMERGFFFGKKQTTIRNGQPLRTTNGILSFIPQSRRFSPAGGDLSMAWLEEISLDIFRYGSTEKVLMAGSTLLNAISQMVRRNGQGNFEISDEVKEYGIGGIRRLRTPTGTLVLKAHPLFSQMVGGTNGAGTFTSMDNAGVVLDMRSIRYRYLRGRDVTFQTDLQLPGVDAKHNGWIAEAGLEVHHPYTHAFISGVRRGVKDAE
jgi:hypothetical protein